MVDTTTTLAPAAAMTSGPMTVTASAALFTAADVGRALSINAPAPARVAATAYGNGAVFISTYAGVDRLYRVIRTGTTATLSASGTTPAYDLNSPRDVGLDVLDGTVTLKYLGSGRLCWGFGVITAFIDTTHVTVTVDPQGPFVSTSASALWKLGEFSNARGWPACVTFHQGRTWWGSTSTKPQTVWASVSGDYENMTPSEPDGTVLDTAALTLALDDDQVNTIRWLASFPKGLAAGTASGEFTIGVANPYAGLSPSNIRAVRQSDRGSDASAPQIRANGIILFVQRGGRKIRQMEYDFASDSFNTIDLSQLADHITGTGVVEVAYAGQPDGFLWALRLDGSIACLTFDKEQKVRAWSRQVIGGSNTTVESIAVVPSADGTSDELMLAVLRAPKGVTVRTFEYLRAPYRADLTAQKDAFFVDAGLTYSSPTVANTFSGLNHLEGQTVKILADGSVRNDSIVVAGVAQATGPSANTVHIGLPYTSRLVSLSPETQAILGTAQGQPRRISEIIIRFLESGGGQYGRDGSTLADVILRTLAMPTATAVPLFTGDRRVSFPNGWDRMGQILVSSSDPLPLTILALIAELETNG